MQTLAQNPSFVAVTPWTLPSKKAVWIGRILSGVISALLAADATFKLLEVPQVIEGSANLGYPPGTIFPMGAILLASVLIYVVPRTSAFGALLITGYLGGAIATHFRVEDPLLTHTLFPIYVAIVVWAGLVLRDERLRAVFFRPQNAR
jgi:hypothetical protein